MDVAELADVGNGVGFNAYMLQDSMRRPWIATWTLDGMKGVELIKTGKKYPLAATQHHNIIDVNGHPEEMESKEAFKRDLVRIGTLDEFNKNPKFAKDEAEPEPTKELSLYPGFKYEGYAWGMAIDLNKCVGCGACVLACQAENNIPVVGQRRSDCRARDALDSSGHLFPRRCGHAGNLFRAGAVHALRERAVRRSLSGGGNGAQSRGIERNDLQPLRGDAVLLEQLSLQGAAI